MKKKAKKADEPGDAAGPTIIRPEVDSSSGNGVYPYASTANMAIERLWPGQPLTDEEKPVADQCIREIIADVVDEDGKPSPWAPLLVICGVRALGHWSETGKVYEKPEPHRVIVK